MNSEQQIDAIRQRAAAAQPGPWIWYGDTSLFQVSLTRVHNRDTVMAFHRWGRQDARPMFNHRGLLETIGRPPKDWGEPEQVRVVYQVSPDATSPDDPRLYRHTFIDIQHPDAQFIAHSRQDVDDLLAEIDRLSAIIEAAGIEVKP